MEAASLPNPGVEGWSEQLTASISAKRENAREFLAAQQERLCRAEAALTAQLEIVAEEVASKRTEANQAKADLDVKASELAAQTTHLEKLKAEFTAQQSQWETLHERYLEEQHAMARELESREAEFACRRNELRDQQNTTEESLARLQREKQALEADQAELEANRGELSATGERLNALKSELDQRREELDARAAETENTRRRIAREFKSSHAAHLKELDLRRSELEQFSSVDQSALSRRCEELQKREAERESEAKSLRNRASELSAEIKSYMERESNLVAEIKTLRQRETELAAEIQDQRQRDAERSREISGLRQRESELAVEIQKLQQQAAKYTDEIAKLRQREADLAAETAGLREHESGLSAEVKKLRQRESEYAVEVQDLQKHETDLIAEVKSLRRQQADLNTEQESAQGHKNDLLRRLEAGLNQQAESSTELHSIRARCRELEDQLAQAAAEAGATAKQCEALRAEQKNLQAQIADLESQLADSQEHLTLAKSCAATDQAEDRDDFSKRYEMAMDDLHELKSKNAELQQQLAKAQSGDAASGKKSGDVLDWEAEKKRILAALESDFNDEESQNERMRIESLIQKTDAIVAAKNREIEELKMLLENQSNNLGSVAVGAAALGEIFDQDAIVCEERENLKRIQDEWREKLRLAEVEISVERAKLARDKSQLEERIRQMEQLGISPTALPLENKTPTKPSRGRWLEKLGLKDGEKDK
jgi:chromosome segregation ATPase